MKKKIVALLIGASTVLALAGCGSKEISNENIKISQYKGVEVDKIETKRITDEDVEAGVQSALSANKISNEVTDRAVKDADIVTLDFVGKIDGAEFEGGSATDYPLTIGSNSFIEGFEPAIVGHKIGESFDVPLTFPDPYQQNPDYSGKPVVFTVTIKSIATESLPELNKEFVKSVTQKDSKTVEEFKKEVKAGLEEQDKASVKAQLQESVVVKVVENTKVTKYPKDRVKEIEDQLKAQYEQMAASYQMEFTEFLKNYINMTEDQFNEQLGKVSKESVKKEMAYELIAEKEKLNPSDKEYKAGLKKLAKDYGFKDVAALKEAAPEEDLKQMITDEKVGTWLVDNCKQVEPKKEEPKKEDTKKEDSKKEDTKSDDKKTDDTKSEDTKKDDK